MKKARIYRPARNAMQSGTAKKRWRLEFVPEEVPEHNETFIEPIMGWTAGTNTKHQVKLSFPTAEEAVAYAREQGIPYTLELPHERIVTPKSYADNFRYDKPEAA